MENADCQLIGNTIGNLKIDPIETKTRENGHIRLPNETGADMADHVVVYIEPDKMAEALALGLQMAIDSGQLKRAVREIMSEVTEYRENTKAAVPTLQATVPPGSRKFKCEGVEHEGRRYYFRQTFTFLAQPKSDGEGFIIMPGTDAPDASSLPGFSAGWFALNLDLVPQVIEARMGELAKWQWDQFAEANQMVSKVEPASNPQP